MNARTRKKPSLTWDFQCVVDDAAVPSRAAFRKWLTAALTRKVELTLRIVGTREGRALNREFRGKDYATNVLTFIYDNRRGRALAGDIVLCAPVVAKEARAQSKSLRAHYAHLTVHGALHLAGYDHEHDDDATRMEAREIAILKRLGIANPYL